MKKSTIFLGAAVAALSAAAGLVGARSAEPVEAMTPTTIGLRGKFNGVDCWSTNYKVLTENPENARFETKVYLHANDLFKLYSVTLDKWAGYHTALPSSVVVGEYGNIGDNIKAVSDGVYTISIQNLFWYDNPSYIFQSSDSGTITYAASTAVTISEYAVVDGAKETSPFASETAYTGLDFTPTNPVRSAKHFGGWFIDEACLVSYSPTSWSGSGTLYSKFTSFTSPKSIYFASPSWANCYVFTFGGNSGFGDWPGTKCTAVTDGVSYQGTGIYKVIYDGADNDGSIIFNDGTGGTVGTDQTNNLILAENIYYKLSDTSTGDLGHGLAAAVIFDINTARRAVTAHGAVLAASVCGISKTKAISLLAEYDGLASSDYRGYVNAATDFVYQYDNTAKGTDVAFSSIIAQLRITAAKVDAVGTIDQAFQGNSTLLIALSVIVTGLTAAGFMIGLTRKRKSEEK